MWDTFTLFAPSYAATLAIGLVCAYLGVFCVLRRIVFTGVALAQLAAGGVAVSFFVADLGLGPISRFAGSYGATWGSLGASLAGLLGLQARPRRQSLSEDALVGLAYSAAGALAIVLVWRSSRGLTELQNILAGTVLLPRTSELVSLWIGLGAVAVAHAIYRRELLLVSFDPEFARAAGLPERRYQLLFLATLAVAVGLALKAGGLLLVFAFLVVPPLAGLGQDRKLTDSTVLALCTAAGGSLLGFLCSIGWDWPVGPSVALSMVALLGLLLACRLDPRAERIARHGALILGAVAVLAAPVALICAPAPPAELESELISPSPATPEDDTDGDPHGHGGHHAGEDAGWQALLTRFETRPSDERAALAEELAIVGGPRAVVPLVSVSLDPDGRVRNAVDTALAVILGEPAAAEAFADCLEAEDAPLLRLHAAVVATRLRDPRGPEALLATLERAGTDLPLLAQDDAVAVLRQLRGGEGFGYDALESPEANAEALARWRDWLRAPAEPAPAEPVEPQEPVVLEPVAPPPPAPTPLERASLALREGPDRAGAARALVGLGSEGLAELEAALGAGPAEAGWAAFEALPPARALARLAADEVLPALELPVARALLDGAAAGLDPNPALVRLLAQDAPRPDDLERVLRVGSTTPDPEGARGAWRELSARLPAAARELVARWLASGDEAQVVAAAEGLTALGGQEAELFEEAWAAAAEPARSVLLEALAPRAPLELSPALRTRYDAASPPAQAALLRRIGQELDAQGWPLVRRGLDAPEPEVRRAARAALAEFSVARSAQDAYRALQEREDATRLVADLRAQLASGTADEARRAAQTLADLQVHAAVGDLVQALERPEPEVVTAARDALQRLGLRNY